MVLGPGASLHARTLLSPPPLLSREKDIYQGISSGPHLHPYSPKNVSSPLSLSFRLTHFLPGDGDTTRFCFSDTSSEVRGHTPGGIATSGDQSFSHELGLEYTRTDIIPSPWGWE